MTIEFYLWFKLLTGTVKGEAVTSVGYIEFNDFSILFELDRFFKAVGKVTSRAMHEVYIHVVHRVGSGRRPQSVQQSQDLVETAVKALRLDQVAPDSFSKIMLRSFW